MILLSSLLMLLAQNPVNPDSAVIADFENHVGDYVKATAKIKSSLPTQKPTDAREAQTKREAEFAAQIRQARPNAAPGEFFTKPVAGEFRRLIEIAYQDRGATRISKSLQHAEPVEGQVKVNDTYPAAVPLQSMPPSLLANLPALPTGIEYRIVGHTLVLRDAQANLVLDFLPKAIP
jgi:hypothetical protein